MDDGADFTRFGKRHHKCFPHKTGEELMAAILRMTVRPHVATAEETVVKNLGIFLVATMHVQVQPLTGCQCCVVPQLLERDMVYGSYL